MSNLIIHLYLSILNLHMDAEWRYTWTRKSVYINYISSLSKLYFCSVSEIIQKGKKSQKKSGEKDK